MNADQKIRVVAGKIMIPDSPIIPFIEGDGIGPDIMRTTLKVLEKAIELAYHGNREVIWDEQIAGIKALEKLDEALPIETLNAIKEYRIAIKGPLITPVSAGYRSLNVALRQHLSLYAGVRPSRYYPGVPSPLKNPELLDVVLFRENTEDVYAGIEWEQGSTDALEVIHFIKKRFDKTIRADSGIGIKPISEFATKRLVRQAIRYAIAHNLPSVTLVHKGNIMKYTEGAFRNWGYEVALTEFRNHVITEDELWDKIRAADGVSLTTRDDAFANLRNGHPPGDPAGRIIIKDRIADQMFQQVLLRPSEYAVIALPNLNGDYLSDACNAQVGGLGLAPGANIGDGIALFEPVHGAAPKYAGLDKVNPTALILSGVMMFEYMGWNEVAELTKDAIGKTISQKLVTYDLARQIENATELKCSEYGEALMKNMSEVKV